MKKILSALFATLLSFTAISQNNTDVIYLKNGKSYKGNIIEQAPNSYYIIKANNDSTYKFYLNEIEKLTKEIDAPKQATSKKEYVPQHQPNFLSVSSGLSISNVDQTITQSGKILIKPLAILSFENGISNSFYIKGSAILTTLGSTQPLTTTDINGNPIGQLNQVLSFNFVSALVNAGFKTNTKVQLFVNAGAGISYIYSAMYRLDGDALPFPGQSTAYDIKVDKKLLPLLNAELGFRYKLFKRIYFNHSASFMQHFLDARYRALLINSGVSVSF
jgi:hypothetical protein